MTGKLEHPIQQQTRLVAAQSGLLLMRNNSGAFQDERGRWIRFGLMNDSKRLNDEVKSSDLIGIVPTLITPDMVGQIVGVFTAIETKREGWRHRPNDPREKAQAKFHQIVRNHGGRAGFLSDPAQLWDVVGGG